MSQTNGMRIFVVTFPIENLTDIEEVFVGNRNLIAEKNIEILTFAY